MNIHHDRNWAILPCSCTGRNSHCNDCVQLIVGPAGEQGIQGERGPRGPRGLKGSTGPQGPGISAQELENINSRLIALEKECASLAKKLSSGNTTK